MTVGAPKTWANSAVTPVTATDMNAEIRDQLTELFGPKRVHAYRTAAMSLASGTSGILVPFDAEAYDTDSMWDPANPSRVVFTSSGLYQITARAMFGTYAPPIRHLQVRMNAAGAATGGTSLTIDQTNPAAGNSGKVGEVFERNFTAGQYIEMFVYQNSGATQASGLNGGVLTTFLQARRVAI